MTGLTLKESPCDVELQEGWIRKKEERQATTRLYVIPDSEIMDDNKDERK